MGRFMEERLRQLRSRVMIEIIIVYQITKTTMQPQQFDKPNQKKKANNPNLLKYQRPIYQLKKNQEGKVQGIIQKLMQQQKQKPQIGFMPRSHLLQQLDSFLPALKQSNQKLATVQVRPEQRIDAKLEQLPQSSSSEDEDEMVDESQKMQTEKPQTGVLESCDEFQFNIMTYPYLEKQGQDKEEKQTQQLTGKFAKVVQIANTGEKMEQLD